MGTYLSKSCPGLCRGSLRNPVDTRICCAVVMRFLFTVARTRSLCRVLAMARVRTWGRSLLVVGTTSAIRAATSSSLTWSASWMRTAWGYLSFYGWNNLKNFRQKKASIPFLKAITSAGSHYPLDRKWAETPLLQTVTQYNAVLGNRNCCYLGNLRSGH